MRFLHPFHCSKSRLVKEPTGAHSPRDRNRRTRAADPAVTFGTLGASAGSDETQAAQQKRGGTLTIARQEDSQSFDKTNVFQNESIWLVEQINESLYTVGPDGKTLIPWLATSYKVSKNGKKYTLQAAQGRPLLEREDDDGGGREVLHRRRTRPGPGLGLPRRRHQERPGAQPLDGRLQPQVPVGTVRRRYRLVRERDHPQELRRPEAGRVLQASDRHGPVHVGQARRRAIGDLQAQPVLLAEGQAVPRRGEVDVRLRPEHAGAAVARGSDPGGRVPALQLDQEAAEHIRREDVPLPVDPDRLSAS